MLFAYSSNAECGLLRMNECLMYVCLVLDERSTSWLVSKASSY